jgi:hypothetical protein
MSTLVRQDQTHTGILAANDIWKIGAGDELSSSGLFRTYNLTLLSNFGEGLIRQSEFRTVEEAQLRESQGVGDKCPFCLGLNSLQELKCAFC